MNRYTRQVDRAESAADHSWNTPYGSVFILHLACGHRVNYALDFARRRTPKRVTCPSCKRAGREQS